MGQGFKLDWQDDEDGSFAVTDLAVFKVENVGRGRHRFWAITSHKCGQTETGEYIKHPCRDFAKTACEEWLKGQVVASLRLWEPEEPTESERELYQTNKVQAIKKYRDRTGSALLPACEKFGFRRGLGDTRS